MVEKSDAISRLEENGQEKAKEITSSVRELRRLNSKYQVLQDKHGAERVNVEVQRYGHDIKVRFDVFEDSVVDLDIERYDEDDWLEFAVYTDHAQIRHNEGDVMLRIARKVGWYR